MEIIDIQTQWASDDIKQLHERITADIAKAFYVPAHIVGACIDVSAVWYQAKVLETRMMQETAMYLLVNYSTPIIYVSSGGGIIERLRGAGVGCATLVDSGTPSTLHIDTP